MSDYDDDSQETKQLLCLLLRQSLPEDWTILQEITRFLWAKDTIAVRFRLKFKDDFHEFRLDMRLNDKNNISFLPVFAQSPEFIPPLGLDDPKLPAKLKSYLEEQLALRWKNRSSNIDDHATWERQSI